MLELIRPLAPLEIWVLVVGGCRSAAGRSAARTRSYFSAFAMRLTASSSNVRVVAKLSRA